MYNSEFIDDMTKSPIPEQGDIDREKFLKEYRKSWPKYLRLVGSGRYSHRRYIGDIDLISLKDLTSTYKWFESHYSIMDVKLKGEKMMSFTILLDDIPADINVWYSTKDNYPMMFLAYAYPRQFTIALRSRLKNKGYKLSQTGLYKIQSNGPVKENVTDIKEIFKLADFPFRSPEVQGKKLNL